MKSQQPDGAVDFISRAIFGIAAALLAMFAVVLTGSAVSDFILAAWARQHVGMSALNGIGYVVVSIAVFDVAKYLVEEEVVRGRELRVTSEARRSLTRFISTIAIAVFLEALVTIFRVTQENVDELLYPTALLLSAIMLVLGLGVYQRLSVMVERQVDEEGKSSRR
jgi:hypothetical protein